MDKTTQRLLMSSKKVPGIEGLVGISYKRSDSSYSGSFTIPYPEGTKPGDLLILVFHGSSPSSVTNWEQKHVYNPNSATNAPVRVFSRIADTASSLVITGTINGWSTYMIAFRSCAWQDTVAPVSGIPSFGPFTIPSVNTLDQVYDFVVISLGEYDSYSLGTAIPELFVNDYYYDYFFYEVFAVDMILSGDLYEPDTIIPSFSVTPIKGASTTQYNTTTYTRFSILKL